MSLASLCHGMGSWPWAFSTVNHMKMSKHALCKKKKVKVNLKETSFYEVIDLFQLNDTFR